MDESRLKMVDGVLQELKSACWRQTSDPRLLGEDGSVDG